MGGSLVEEVVVSDRGRGRVEEEESVAREALGSENEVCEGNDHQGQDRRHLLRGVWDARTPRHHI